MTSGEGLENRGDNNDAGQRRPKQFDVAKSTSKWLEHLASAKVWEELIGREGIDSGLGFEKHLGYSTTDITIKGIEEGNLCVYKNRENGTYWITTKNNFQKYIDNIYEFQKIHDKIDQDLKLIEELERNPHKIKWDLPKIHAIRTVDEIKVDEHRTEGKFQEDIDRPRENPEKKRATLITDNESIVRERIENPQTEEEKKGWKAALPWASPEFDISSEKGDSKKPTKQERLMYKAFYKGISDKTKGQNKDIYENNKELLQNIEEAGKKSREAIIELEKEFIKMYYDSDSYIRKEYKTKYNEYMKQIKDEISKIKGEPQRKETGKVFFSSIADSLGETLRELKNKRDTLQSIVHDAIKRGLSKLGLGDLLSGKHKIFIKGDLYLQQGKSLTDKKPDQTSVPVDVEQLEKIKDPKGIQCDLKVYVIQPLDQASAKSNPKDKEILITDDRDLVARRIRDGWKALPGTQIGIELNSDKIEEQRKIYEVYKQLQEDPNQKETWNALKLCDEIFSQLYRSNLPEDRKKELENGYQRLQDALKKRFDGENNSLLEGIKTFGKVLLSYSTNIEGKDNLEKLNSLVNPVAPTNERKGEDRANGLLEKGRRTDTGIESNQQFAETKTIRIGEKAAGLAKITKLTESQQNELKGSIEIHDGKDTPREGEDTKNVDRKLTVEDLAKAGLLPQHAVKIENATILISPIYKIGKRVAVIGYVQQGDKYIARSYYLSQSQGIWRYLPRYSPVWYDKGHSEQSITVPIPLQFALIDIQKQQKQPIDVKNPDFYFAGTARLWSPYNETGTYIVEVEESPRLLEGNFFAKANGKVPPEKVTFTNTKQAPDFSRLIASTQQKTELYGQITIDVYESKDQKLQYMFCRDKHNRVWIGGVEDVSESNKIQSVGLRKRWVNAGDLTTPAYEYREQAREYGNEEDRQGERKQYVDTFEKYLKNIPVIQEYLKSTRPSREKAPQRPVGDVRGTKGNGSAAKGEVSAETDRVHSVEQDKKVNEAEQSKRQESFRSDLRSEISDIRKYAPSAMLWYDLYKNDSDAKWLVEGRRLQEIELKKFRETCERLVTDKYALDVIDSGEKLDELVSRCQEVEDKCESLRRLNAGLKDIYDKFKDGIPVRDKPKSIENRKVLPTPGDNLNCLIYSIIAATNPGLLRLDLDDKQFPDKKKPTNGLSELRWAIITELANVIRGHLIEKGLAKPQQLLTVPSAQTDEIINILEHFQCIEKRGMASYKWKLDEQTNIRRLSRSPFWYPRAKDCQEPYNAIFFSPDEKHFSTMVSTDEKEKMYLTEGGKKYARIAGLLIEDKNGAIKYKNKMWKWNDKWDELSQDRKNAMVDQIQKDLKEYKKKNKMSKTEIERIRVMQTSNPLRNSIN